MKQFSFLLLIFIITACNQKRQRKVGLQPFDQFPNEILDSVASAINSKYGFEVYKLPKKVLPKTAFTKVKTPRYRADSLLRSLKHNKPDSINYILGLTQQDISTTKRNPDGTIKTPEYKYRDWGVFGLGYVSGPSSIVSTYRYKKSSQSLFIQRIQKICVHELGHNLGLKHCRSGKPCVMQDAAESIKTIDNVENLLCSSCKRKINLQ